MFGEVVKMLESAAKAQAKPTVTVQPDERLRTTFVVNPDGQVTPHPWRLPSYQRTALSLNGLVGVVAKSPGLFHDKVQISVGDCAVLAVLDDAGERRHRVLFQGSLTPIMKYLSIDEDEEAWLEQEAICRMLRTETVSCEPSTIANQLAAQKLRRTVEADMATEPVGRNARSISTLEEASSPDGSRPKEIVDLFVRVSPGLRWQENPRATPVWFEGRVRCTVRINYSKGLLALRPVGGEIDRLRSDARRWVMDRVEEGLIGSDLECSVVEALPV